ncbi:MAG: DUF4347 domain-containing protein [Synechococcales cyanobacterium CRU_2_2]|nr:DUF4347 domain-containing protein [Synechococcales cyanobacterium CRU_2_2]
MQSVLFIDSSVENSQVLLANLQLGIQVHRLSSGSSGVEQITKILRCQYADAQIGQIHLVSHGSPGCLYLGNSELSLDSIDGYTNQLKAWFHVSLNPQLLIYGCKVALGDAGSEFVNKLRHITGAEVAASTTLIGSPALGGNWDLDVVTGQQKVSLVFSENIQAAYAHVLEGTKQLSPAATDILALSVLEQGGTGEAFAGYNAPATRRLNIHIADPANEVVYLGFSKLINGSDGAETTTPYYFRIKDPNGNIVKGPIKVDPLGSAGSVTPNLTSHAQAVTGPSAITGGGYTVSNSSWTFDPSGPAGDYYIEFDFNDTATIGTDGFSVRNNINIKWFDITVADTSTTTPTAIEGRVWSQAWQFRAQEVGYGTFDEPFNGKVYTYDSNQLVTEVDFAGSGFKPLQFNLAFNDSGPAASGNIANDRRSVIGSALNPEHKVFLNTPDPAIYPKETLGSFVATSFKVDDTSNPQIEVIVTKPGLVELILDFDQNGSFTAGTDVRLIANVTAGKNLISWNGKNGTGAVVSPASYPISVIATYGQGITNFTAYDVEGLDSGFKVIDATNTTAKLFWDDSNIAVSPDSNPADDVKVNVDIGATKRQTWSTTTDGVTIRNYGNGNTINTWWYANRVVTTGLVAANKPPIVDLDGNVAGTDFSVSFVEGNAAVAIADTDVVVTDIDDTKIESATITLTNRLDGVLEVLAVNGALPAGITAVNYNTTTGVLKLNGSATLVDYQTAIAQIQYNNTSDSPNTTSRIITVRVNDGILDSNLATSTITIQPSNDPPTVDLNGSLSGTNYTTTFVEGNAAVAIATNTATLNDPDGTDIETLILSLNSIPDASNEVLNIGGQAIALTNGAGTAIAGTTTFVITAINGVVTIAKQGGGDIASTDIQTLLRGITYQNNSDAPTGSSRVITVKVNDGIIDSNLATSTITIQPSNDPPIVDLDSSAAGAGYATTFQEGDAAVAIAAAATAATDADDANLESAIVTLTNPASGDVLHFNGTPVTNNTTANPTGIAGLTFAVSVNGATLTFSGSATKAQYETVLKAIAFGSTSDNPAAGNRIITVVVNDGDAASNTATSTITVTPVNDPPAIDLNGPAAGNDYNATYTENALGTSILGATTAIADVDDTNIELAIVTLTNPASGDVLSFNGSAVVNGSNNNPTGVAGLTFKVSADGSTLTFSGSATKAQYETALKAIAFKSTSENPTAGNRTITVVVNDGDANSNIATSTITVTPVNDPPIIDLNGVAVGNNYNAVYVENAVGTSIVGATTAVTDVDDTNIESAIVTLTNPSSGDVLSFNGTAVSNGTPANPTGVAGLTFAVSADGSTLTFSGSATKTEYETVLKAIAFQNTLDNPVGGNRTITVMVKDGDDNSNIATSTITVTPVNDAPTIDLNGAAIAGADYSATYIENAAAVAVTNTTAATIADLDDTDINTLTLTVGGLKDGTSEVLSIGGKTIALSGTVNNTTTVGGTTFSIAATNGVVTLTQSGGVDIPSADLQTLLRSITYQNTKPSPTEGNRTISWLANDGIANSNPATSTINILRDRDADGIIDNVDLDDDNDGILDTAEEQSNPNRDTDGDGILDRLDLDADNDGITDIVESGLTPAQVTALDGNGDGRIDPTNSFGSNGFADLVETTPGSGTAIYGKPVDTDGDTRPDFQDLDTDNDGLNDVVEAGGKDLDGNGLIDGATTDTDKDGLADAVDPTGSLGTLLPNPDTDKDGIRDFRDLDSDNDGLPDLAEGGLNPITVDLNGDGVVDGPDGDSDGIQNAVDGTPTVFGDGNGPASDKVTDTDGDRIPDYREVDSDNDTIPDRIEAGLPQGPTSPDGDRNGVADNPIDTDKDGIADAIDSKPGGFGGFEDTDKDGIANFKDLDDDNDGILDTVELAGAPTTGPNIGDTDGDGILDSLDLDTDNDGINDVVEARHGGTDANGDGQVDGAVGTDGIPDGVQATPDSSTVKYGNPVNSDTDGKADFQDLDSDNDSLSDLFEGGSGGTDANDNGVIDGPDADGDGILDSVDGNKAGFGDSGSPVPPNSDTDPNPDYLDLDSNADGVKDIATTGNGLLDANKDGAIDSTVDLDKDGIRDVVDDSDLDGTPDVKDTTPNPSFGGLSKPDTDKDGVSDTVDLDDDNDGILDTVEELGNPIRDTDGDGILDRLDLDADNDGITDIVESGLTPAQVTALDSNRDGRIDPTNSFGTNGFADPVEAAPGSGTAIYGAPIDTDGDTRPDFQDLDSDNDGLNDVVEAGGADTDGNGLIDGTGTDADGDGLANVVDPSGSPGTPLPIPDSDSDGAQDFRDLDSDNDGLPDLVEGGLNPQTVDLNGDGVVDGPDGDSDGIQNLVDGTPAAFGDNNGPRSNNLPNADGDSIPDYREPDRNNNGIPDRIEAGLPQGPSSPDANGNGVIDNPADADKDGIADSLDSKPGVFGGFEDTDKDGIANFKDLDDDNDGILDTVELAGAPTTGPNIGDTDGDGILDSLDLDADNDGILDVVEARHGGADTNGDGQVDGTVGTDGIPDIVQATANSGTVKYGNPVDSDTDGKADFQDLDSDNDSLSDLFEGGSGGTDTDDNGVLDLADSDADGIANSIDGPTAGFGDGNGYAAPPDADSATQPNSPDYIDVDSNNDGFKDIVVAGKGLLDVNGDGVIDNTVDLDKDGIRDVVDDSDLDRIPDSTDPTPNPAFGGLRKPDVDGDGIADVIDLDDDNDGILDSVEENGNPTRDTDGDGVLDRLDLDADNDGILDVIEARHPGTDADGNGQVDGTVGTDGIPDRVQADPNGGTVTDVVRNSDNDPNPDFQDLDSDNDGLSDLFEGGSGGVDLNRDGVVDGPDSDGDGIRNSVDGAPGFGDSGSPVPPNQDGDAEPDYTDLDSDNDGATDILEASNGKLDTDGDGRIDNPTDIDLDGIRDVIDDSDLDGTPDAIDTTPNPAFGGLAPVDTDQDGIADINDLDDDNDGILDSVEEKGNPKQDTDGDGVLDRLDLDADNDGINDLIEAGHGGPDENNDGIIQGPVGTDGIPDILQDDPNSRSINYGNPLNSDNDDNPDFQDLDSDNDSLSDLGRRRQRWFGCQS